MRSAAAAMPVLLLWMCASGFSVDALHLAYAPVTADTATGQQHHLMQLNVQGRTQKLALDLSADLLWTDCRSFPASPSFTTARCHTPFCTASGSKLFGCGTCRYVPATAACKNDTCRQTISDPMSGAQSWDAALALDTLAFANAELPQFALACAPTSALQGLPAGATGVAGLNWSPLAMPLQAAVALEVDRKFGLCLGSGGRTGLAFFGGPPGVPGARGNFSFLATPMYPRQYFVRASAIAVNGRAVDLGPGPGPAPALTVNMAGSGGTVFSAMAPYGRMVPPLYAAVTQAFAREAAHMGLRRAPPAGPLDVCFEAAPAPDVPVIDLVLDNEFVVWHIGAANSMVQVSDGVMCLAFVEADKFAQETLVLGAQQLLDNLVVFDLVEFRFLFTNNLRHFNTSCAQIYSTVSSAGATL